MRADLMELRAAIVRVERLVAEWRQDVVDAASVGDTKLALLAVGSHRLEALVQAVDALRHEAGDLRVLVGASVEQLEALDRESGGGYSRAAWRSPLRETLVSHAEQIATLQAQLAEASWRAEPEEPREPTQEVWPAESAADLAVEPTVEPTADPQPLIVDPVVLSVLAEPTPPDPERTFAAAVQDVLDVLGAPHVPLAQQQAALTAALEVATVEPQPVPVDDPPSPLVQRSRGSPLEDGPCPAPGCTGTAPSGWVYCADHRLW